MFYGGLIGAFVMILIHLLNDPSVLDPTINYRVIPFYCWLTICSVGVVASLFHTTDKRL